MEEVESALQLANQYPAYGLGIVVALFILFHFLNRRTIKISMKENGNGSSEALERIKKQLITIEENHMHDLSAKMDRMLEMNIKQLTILEDIREELRNGKRR